LPIAVSCQGLVKCYGEVVAVAGLDLVLHVGECFGLLGPNGAGKTTTIEILEGLQTPDQGRVEVLGLRWATDERRLRERLGIQLQETQLNDKLTVEETLGLFRSFYVRGRTVDEVLRLVELESKRRSWVGRLSGGQRQRLAIGCALINAPEILFLDEPTTGLDPQSRRQLWALLSTFRQNGGTTLLTTHHMEEAEALCDRVAVVDQGRVIAIGSPRELIASLGADQIIEFALAPRCPAVSREALTALPGVRDARVHDDAARLVVSEVGLAVPALLSLLGSCGGELTRLQTHHATLEDVFVALTGRHLRDA
jgi:ABC-2 type transport system ATP-binding protein